MELATGLAVVSTIMSGGQMNLDVITLFHVTIYVEAILGMLLLFAWVQNMQIRAVAWWGSAHILRAGSILLFGMYGTVSDSISIEFANVLLFLTYAILWAGARVFDGRTVNPVWVVAGPGIWLLGGHLPAIAGSLDTRFLLSVAIITAYTWATAYEFWRGRYEPLVSRWPAVFLLFAHGSLFLLRTPLATFLPWSQNDQLFDSVWLTVLSFEALLFTIAIAFILLAMAKERIELRHKTAAMVDPLTGIANRRAFLDYGEANLRRIRGQTRPTGVLLFDLDQFKGINDRFGHALGDRVLQIFTETAKANLRQTDVFGRIGGEEFAAVLSDTGREKAALMAEDIRSAFACAAAEVNGHDVGATVSIGVVAAADPALDLASLMVQADHALYLAKARGRNRVETATLDLLRFPDAGDKRLSGAAA